MKAHTTILIAASFLLPCCSCSSTATCNDTMPVTGITDYAHLPEQPRKLAKDLYEEMSSRELWRFFLYSAEQMNEETGGRSKNEIFSLMLSFVKRGLPAFMSPDNAGGWDGKYPTLTFMKEFWLFVLEEGPFSIRAEGDRRSYREPYEGLVSCLGQVREERAVPVLLGRMRTDDQYTRLYTKTLAEICTPEAIEGLKRLVDDPDFSQSKRNAIIETVPNLDEMKPVAPPSKPQTWKKTTPEPLRSLILDLASADYKTREKATGKLIEMGPDPAPVLEKVLKQTDDPEIKQRISQILASPVAWVLNRLNTIRESTDAGEIKKAYSELVQSCGRNKERFTCLVAFQSDETGIRHEDSLDFNYYTRTETGTEARSVTRKKWRLGKVVTCALRHVCRYTPFSDYDFGEPRWTSQKWNGWFKENRDYIYIERREYGPLPGSNSIIEDFYIRVDEKAKKRKTPVDSQTREPLTEAGLKKMRERETALDRILKPHLPVKSSKK